MITVKKGMKEKIFEILNKKEEGVFVLELDSKNKEMIKEYLEKGKIRKSQISQGILVLINLSDNLLKIEIKDVNKFRNALFERAEEFTKDESIDTVFMYPEDMKDMITEEIAPYLDAIGEDFAKRVDDTRYRGYLTKIEKKDNNYELSKNFIARYKLFIFNKNNKPYARIGKISNEVMLYRPNRRDYKIEDDDSIICLYKNLEILMDENNISDSDILIDEDSIEKFYVFDDNYFVNPTTKWVEKWWDYDCPRLYRFETNIKGTTNFFGVGIVCWINLLVESGWSYTQISEDITKEEVEQFAKNYTHTEIYNQMSNVLKAREISKEEKEEKIRKAKEIEKTIQEVINNNEHKIFLDTLSNFVNQKELKEVKNLSTEELEKKVSTIDGTMGFDCGFLYMSLKEGVDLFKEIAQYDSNRLKSGALKINYPIKVQSTTIKREMAKVIENIVKKETGYNLKYWTVLD